MNRTLIALSAAALLVSPSLAMAQSAPSQTVTINGTVDPACTLGSPDAATLDLGTLTGADGRLAPALASSAVAAQTDIDNAWCNTPSVLTFTASPLTLTIAPGYAQPAGFAREITYNATLTDWSAAVVNRPLTANNAETVTSTGAHAADPLGVEFSNLAPLIGGAETPTAYLEAGAYSATVQITLAVN